MSTLPDAVAGRQQRASDSAVRRVSANMASTRQFVDDDAGYLNWITSYPDRFVLNTCRRPTPACLVLHHASCRTIRARSNWTKDYRKVGGERGELEAFAREEVGGDTQPYSRCF